MAAPGSDSDDITLASRRRATREDLPLSNLAEERRKAQMRRELPAGRSESVSTCADDQLAEASKASEPRESKASRRLESSKAAPLDHFSGRSRKRASMLQAKAATDSIDIAAPMRSSPRQRDAQLALESSPLTGLPWEIQFNILKAACSKNAVLVCRLSTVCSQWRQLEDDPSVWKRVEIPRTRSSLCDDKLVKRITSKGTWAELEKLKLKGTKITDKALVHLSEFCPRLSDLNLADCNGVTGTGILAFVKKQPALRALTLSRLAGRFVNDTMIKALVGERPQLEYLRLKGCESIGSSTLRGIATVLPHLRVLDLTGAGATRASIVCPIILLQANCSNLEVLRLSGLGASPFSWTPWVTMEEGRIASIQWAMKLCAMDEDAQYLPAICAAQSGINFLNRGQGSEAGASKPAEGPCGFARLRELRVAPDAPNVLVVKKTERHGHTRLTDAALWQILKGSPQLRVLDVTGLNSFSKDLLRAIPAGSLEVLLMAGSQSLRGGALEVAVSRWGSSLLDLDVSRSSAISYLQSISDECQALRRLNVSYTAVREDDVRAVLSCPRLGLVLTSLDTSGCRTLPRELRLPWDSDISVLKGKLGLGEPSSSLSERGVPPKKSAKRARKKPGRAAEISGSGEGASPESQEQSPHGRSKVKRRRQTSASKTRARKRMRPFGVEADSEDDSDYTPGKKEAEDTYAWD